MTDNLQTHLPDRFAEHGEFGFESRCPKCGASREEIDDGRVVGCHKIEGRHRATLMNCWADDRRLEHAIAAARRDLERVEHGAVQASNIIRSLEADRTDLRRTIAVLVAASGTPDDR